MAIRDQTYDKCYMRLNQPIFNYYLYYQHTLFDPVHPSRQQARLAAQNFRVHLLFHLIKVNYLQERYLPNYSDIHHSLIHQIDLESFIIFYSFLFNKKCQHIIHKNSKNSNKSSHSNEYNGITIGNTELIRQNVLTRDISMVKC